MALDPLLSFERAGAWTVVAWKGDVDIANAVDFEHQSLGHVENTDTGCVVDLGAVTYLDSAGIRSLARMHRLLQERQQGLRLVVPAGSVLRRALDIGGLLEVIPAFADREAALSATD